MKKYRTLEVGEIFQGNDEERCITFDPAGEDWVRHNYTWEKVCSVRIGKMVTLSNYYRRPISKRKIG